MKTTTVVENKLESDEVKQMRQEKMLDKLMWKKIREVVINMLFLLVAYIVAYSFKDVNSYNYQLRLKTMLTQSRSDGCVAYDDVYASDFFCVLFLET
jgi:hypothetical protein